MPITPKSGFDGLRVLSLESRRAEEMAKLIRNNNGQPLVAPSMREVPLGDNREALHFAGELIAGRVGAIILLTGVGTRIVLRAAEAAGHLAEFLAALKKVPIVARGPKPVAVLAEIGIKPTVAVPEPNTWRELLQTLDENIGTVPLRGHTVAVQEYGASNPELLDALRERGASVLRVPVYDWQLPEDLGPLRSAVQAIVNGEIDVILFTTSVQVRHLMQIAKELQLENTVIDQCRRMIVGSIGPVTSEELQRFQIAVDLEPSHPRMGFLVSEIAARSAELLGRKRAVAPR
jgi:uroporphyrinogen-III synthase